MKALSIGLAIAAVATTGAITMSVYDTSKSATVRLETDLPRPMYTGTPGDVRNASFGQVAGARAGRAPFLVPAGVTNVALGKPVTASSRPTIGRLQMITNGDKEGADSSCVELPRRLQHITIDLGAPHEIHAVFVWHYHKRPRVYFDVVVQTAADPDFTLDVRTLFNNDANNSAGLGAGKDRRYIDTYRGKLIEAKGVTGRYVRLYSNGNSSDGRNHYIEVEVYGRPL